MTPVRYDPRTQLFHMDDGSTCSDLVVEMNRPEWPRDLVAEFDRVSKRDREAARLVIYDLLATLRPDVFHTLH